MAKNYWLVKSEPEVFSFEDLLKAPQKTTSWEGVRNYQARNFMRDQFKIGDEVFFYHSNTEVPAIHGVCEVVREGYPDFYALDSKSKYFDSDAKKKGVNPWVMVDLKAVQKFSKPVTRDILKEEAGLEELMVLQKGSRLSVQPVTPAHFAQILKLGSPIKV